MRTTLISRVKGLNSYMMGGVTGRMKWKLRVYLGLCKEIEWRRL